MSNTEIIVEPTIRLGKFLKWFSEIEKSILNTILAALFASQLLVSIFAKDFTWLASFGGLLGVVALLLISSQSFLTDYEIEIHHLHLNGQPETLSVGGFTFADQVTDKEKIQEIITKRREAFNEKYKNIIYYLALTVIGTVFWAYAGFLNKVFFPQACA